MRDIELSRALLGLTAPWTVGGVDVDMVGQRVDAGAGPYPCPECGTPGPRYDSKPRRWRHLDTMQFTTWIEADVPRVDCGTHGVKQVRVPWAEPGSQFTALFERWRSTCCESAPSRAPAACCGSAGTKAGGSRRGRSSGASPGGGRTSCRGSGSMRKRSP